jgi:glycosyltransferase involved in cell wall biosynthesis
VKVGLIARGEDRGLGIQTWEFYRHVKPDKVLLIDMGALAGGFALHDERYPTAERAVFERGELPEEQVRAWLEGLDVVYTAETFYDWRLVAWAAEQGVATVCHINPEFYRHGKDDLPVPSAWWAPTPWRLVYLPETTRVVRYPVALERFHVKPDVHDGPCRWLHVMGRRAAGDRNGTLALMVALRRLGRPARIAIASQERRLATIRSRSRHVTVENRPGGIRHYWDLYDGADMLVMPRRYGGLCLPVQEAMAAGLGVVMPDIEPNDCWPTVRVPARPAGTLQVSAGELRLYDTAPGELARTMDRFADPEERLKAQQQARQWAEWHSWEQLLPLYRTELARAAERP